LKTLSTGKYLGCTKRSVDLGGLIISDTEYIRSAEFPTHFHENLYLACVLKGYYYEISGGKKIVCLPGSVTFHNFCEGHSNSGFSSYSRIINLEISSQWLIEHQLDPNKVESNAGSHNIEIQNCMSRIASLYFENEDASQPEIESNVLVILGSILSMGSIYLPGTPAWVKTVREFIRDNRPELLTLKNIAVAAGIHPVHLSRDFPRYFRSSFAGYIRKVKIERARKILKNESESISTSAIDSGFSDQSHFTRVFRKSTGITPNKYKHLLSEKNKG